MSGSNGGDITQLLGRVKDGEPGARDRLFEILYRQVRETAAGLMQRERADHTLQPSALFAEAFLRLEEDKLIARASDRRYLIGAICQAMRCVLVDHARSRRAEKRGGDMVRQSLDFVCDFVEKEHGCDLVELDEQLKRLGQLNTRAGQVVELKFFGELTTDEIAAEVGVSISTVESDWRFAQAWLHRQLRS